MLHFVGTVGGFERPLVEKTGVSFESHDEVQAGPIHGVNPLRALASIAKLMLGTLQAFRLLRHYKPQVIFSTGGWVSLPVALVASVLRVPLLVYLPDLEPGRTIKLLRHFAAQVAVTVPESQQYFKPGQTVVTGYPLRAEIRTATHAAAQSHFGLAPDCRTLLVFGGSRGARAINIITGDILAALLEAGVQVIHVTGTLDHERTLAQAGELVQHPNYHPHAYLHGSAMGLAFAAADLAVCRAGASILGEFPHFRLPSILIPLAYSWHYQQVNADYMQTHGAAVHLDETDAADQLLPLILELFDDPARLTAMRDAAAALSQTDGAATIAQALAQLAREGA